VYKIMQTKEPNVHYKVGLLCRSFPLYWNEFFLIKFTKNANEPLQTIVMENIKELLPQILMGLLVIIFGLSFVVFWNLLVLKWIITSFIKRICLMFEEIRDELKELNKNNLVK
jgi:hypothetical protein